MGKGRELEHLAAIIRLSAYAYLDYAVGYWFMTLTLDVYSLYTNTSAQTPSPPIDSGWITDTDSLQYVHML